MRKLYYGKPLCSVDKKTLFWCVETRKGCCHIYVNTITSVERFIFIEDISRSKTNKKVIQKRLPHQHFPVWYETFAI
jgi:hypothetical protein